MCSHRRSFRGPIPEKIMSTHIQRPSIPATFLLAGLACLTGCRAFTVSSEAPKASEPSDSGTASKPAAADEDSDKAFKIEQAAQKLEIAKLEVEVAHISAEAALRKAEQELESARKGLDEQRRELEYFKTVTMPVQLEQAQISHDRSTHRADESLDELRELESMYASEEFAEMTKELVLKRGRRSLELAKRSLEVSAMNMKGLREEELPKKQRALELELLEAEQKLARAETELEKTRIEARVSQMKSRQKIADAEKAVRDAKKDKSAKKEDAN